MKKLPITKEQKKMFKKKELNLLKKVSKIIKKREYSTKK